MYEQVEEIVELPQKSLMRITQICIAFLLVPSFCFGQLNLVNQFNPGDAAGFCGLGVDQVTGELWAYACVSATVNGYTPSGTSLGTLSRPGEAADDADIDFTTKPVTIGSTSVPAGTLFFFNGESGVTEIYAIDTGTGAIIETLVTDFGVSHVVGGAYHPDRETFFLVQDSVPGAPDGNRIAEIDPVTGNVLNEFSIASLFSVFFGDIEVGGATGNLYVVSSSESRVAEVTPEGDLVQYHNYPGGVFGISGIGIFDSTGETWLANTSGTIYQIDGLVPALVQTESISITAGIQSGGDVFSLACSDNVDYSARRNNSDLQSRVVAEMKTTSPTATPTSFEFTFEAAVFARTTVNQSIDFFNYVTGSWEEVNVGTAQRFTDRTVTVVGTGDLSRFVDLSNLCIEARVRFRSPVARQQFTANMDQAVWRID